MALISKPLSAGGYSVSAFPVLAGQDPSPWNIHHVHLDRLPILHVSNPARLEWLNPHVSLQMSDRQKAMREAAHSTKIAAQDNLMNVKDTIHALLVQYAGLQGQHSQIFGLKDPDEECTYALIFVDKLRLDEAAFTVVADVAVLPLSNDLMPSLDRGLRTLTSSSAEIARIATRGSEVAAWKRLLPACVERCRTWPHRANCEYIAQGKIPLSIVIDEMPICSCGRGVDLPPDLHKMAAIRLLLPFATRAAISPIFSVSYIERVAGAALDMMNPTATRPSPNASAPRNAAQVGAVCLSCGQPGKPRLLSCSKCKTAKYCSASCQRNDWKDHKATCKASSAT